MGLVWYLTSIHCGNLELELLSAVWGAAHKSASLVRGPVRGHHGNEFPGIWKVLEATSTCTSRLEAPRTTSDISQQGELHSMRPARTHTCTIAHDGNWQL